MKINNKWIFKILIIQIKKMINKIIQINKMNNKIIQLNKMNNKIISQKIKNKFNQMKK